jgi:hypothetical protein
LERLSAPGHPFKTQVASGVATNSRPEHARGTLGRSGLGHRFLGAIVMHRQPANDDHALIRLDPQAHRALMTTVFDAAGNGSGKAC